MWLLTSVGFFSIVRKPSDAAAGTLTVRARVREDLEALRAAYLPGLSQVVEGGATDYRFRATAPRAQVEAALAAMVRELDYDNFKHRVAQVQGNRRAALYHDVWEVLHRLQPPAPRARAAVSSTSSCGSLVVHPRPDENGHAVLLVSPSRPSPLQAWTDGRALACVTPDGAMPERLNDIAFSSWHDAPRTPAGWAALAEAGRIPEPPFVCPPGTKRAAGVVVREPDGRVWAVAPSNAFGGYKATFPKGTVEPGAGLQATALQEAFEESGLRVRLLSHLVDVQRSTSRARYYLAERVGGNPADMGWESQAVMLVPPGLLHTVLAHPNDAAILAALA